MTSTERSAFPGSSFSYIAAAMEKALSSLNSNYKKLSVTFMLARIHSIFHKVSRKSKNGDENQNKLPKYDSQESGQRNVARDNTADSDPSITQELNAENTPIKTLIAIYPRNNIYDKAGETSSSIEVSWCERGLTLSDLGQFEDALESYKRALEINPRSFKAFKNRANVLYRVGRYDEAIDDFKKALEINPQLIDAWYGMGNSMSKLGRYKEAVSAYENALKINYSFIDAWVGRGT